MSPERWQQIDRLYHDALDRKPEERAAFLAGACQDDQDLHREVLSLLAADCADDMLNRPAWEAAPSLLDPSTATQITPGAQLGPYQIEHLLGAGGMGKVYRARDTRLHRTVAIKLLPGERLADADRKLRFLQEARAASALSHPNIVTLYDIASDNGRDYLVLEYVAGKTLAQLLTPKGLPIEDALHFAAQIANGLAAAHAAGIVHRDIKPANIIVTSEGQVKILDFGLAKLQPSGPAMAAPETAHTAPGVVMGTPAYMSPEQAAGREADQRTDIFSLGVVLYETLSGVRPFRGASQVDTLHAILNSPAPPLSPERPDLPPEIDEILSKALAKDPRERYQHAADFELDLRRFARAWKAKELPTQRIQAPAPPPLARLSPVVTPDEGGFPPGLVLLQRYRLLNRLGKGGMAEVYRAFDMLLGQDVALKFLPDSLARDQAALDRLRGEVRLARQISHPNVCRVYDMGEAEGHVFLTMEFIDGENLASLLRRIGRIPQGKALEIARRLCAGLAAAHDKSVLHRDLKPANIMIDGRGQVLITDFGLAALAGQVRESEIGSGTAAYMSPEQLAGREVTAGSDLYSLGLVLYEMFSGKRAFEDSRRTALVPVSSHARDIDPAVDRVIARCLEEDPRARPSSALAVVAALPGGDPLAAALAAGETPSPEMVAASGAADAMPVRTAVLWMCAVLAGLVAAIFLAGMANRLTSIQFDKSTDALAQRARDLAEALGYPEPPTDRAYGFTYDEPYIRYAASKMKPEDYRAQRASGKSPFIGFWYRQSPRYLEALNFFRAVDLDDPPVQVSGMVNMTLTPRGGLLSFAAVPPQVNDPAATPGAPVDWQTVFTAAGLEFARFVPTQPERLPLAGFDSRAAWTGAYPIAPHIPLRIEAASWRGKPVSFELVFPWTQPLRMEPFRLTPGSQAGVWIVLGLLQLLLIAAALLAWRNRRIGRGDTQGAARLAAFGGLSGFLIRMSTAHHVPAVSEAVVLFAVIAYALLDAAIYWVLYLSLEPYLRRRWPQRLIGWTRLLAGGLHDPLVGGDVLSGVALGLALSLISAGEEILLIGYSRVQPYSASQAIGGMFATVFGAIVFALGFLFLSFLLLALLRRQWLATSAWLLIVLVVSVLSSSNHPLANVALSLLSASLMLFGLIRFGVLAMAVAFFVKIALTNHAITADLSAWSSGPLLILAAILLLAIYGFYNALAGRPLFKYGFLEN